MSFASAPSDQDLSHLAAKVVWLSGAASGIGRALALRLASRKCKLALGDLDIGGLKSLSDEITSAGGECVYRECDVTSWSSQKVLFDAAFQTFGSVDVVLPNAGVSLLHPFVDVDDNGDPVKPSLKTIDINLSAVLYSSALAFHYFALPAPAPSSPTPPPPPAARFKALVLTGSMASLFGTWPESIEYSASKAGVLGILNGLRGRCKEDDIGLGMVAPYFVRTPLMPEEFEPPLGWAKLETVLEAFLLSLTIPSGQSTGSVHAVLGEKRGGGILVMGEKDLRPVGWVEAGRKSKAAAGRARL